MLHRWIDGPKPACGASSTETLEEPFFLAILKLVEIVGEAAMRVSETTRSARSEIPWRQIIGVRNRLVHGYDAVDRGILWEIVTSDFPPLACQIEALLRGNTC